MALGCSPVSTPMPRRIRRLTFQSAVTSEICESLRAFESARVERVWQTPKSRHQTKKPGLSSGQPLATQAMKANGRRNVKRPQTLMYSSSEWPRRFIVVLRRTWNRAAASDRRSHMVRDPIPRAGPGTQLERVRDRLGRAGGLDDQIHAFAPGKPPGGVSGLALGGRVRDLGAELAREGEAPSRAAHDDHPRPAGAKDLEGQEPECAGTH